VFVGILIKFHVFVVNALSHISFCPIKVKANKYKSHLAPLFTILSQKLDENCDKKSRDRICQIMCLSKS
jgi:hypothetical protein